MSAMNDELSLSPAVDDRLGYHLRRVSAMTMSMLGEALSELDLRVVEVTVLFELSSKPGITLSDIGRILGIKRANVTPLVASLVERGLLISKPKDGRSQALSLSKAGAALADKALKVINDSERQFFSVLSEDAKEVMINQLRAVWQSQNQSEDVRVKDE